MPHDNTARQDRLAIAYSNVAHSFTHLMTVLYATAVLYLPGVFDMPYGELLALSSLGLVLYGVAAMPAGWLADRWSTVGMMVIFFLGIGAGAILTGIAEGANLLFAGLTLIGLFAAIYHPVGVAWIVASAERQGISLGINGVFGSIGNAIAPVFVGLMIDFGHWRMVFILPGILSIAAGIALFWSWRTAQVRDATADRTQGEKPRSGAFVRVFVILTVTMACTGFVYAGLTNTMPKMFETGVNLWESGSYTQIGLMVGGISALASFSSIAGGWLADRYSARMIFVIFWAMQVPFLFVFAALTNLPLLVVALLLLCLNGTFTAAENMLVAQYTPFRWRALAYGAKFVLALGVGGLTVHFAGWLFDRDGDFALLYLIFGFTAAVAAACAIFLPGSFRRRVVTPSIAAAE